jgi:hypothetical protein
MSLSELSLGNSGESHYDKPNITKGGKTYRFYTNFSLVKPEASDNSNDANSESRRSYREKQITAGNNRHKMYIELAKRGFGIIPESPAKDSHGGDLPTNWLSFYEDTRLERGTSHKIETAVTDLSPDDKHPFHYIIGDGPEREFTREELSEMLDRVLAEDRFATERSFAEEYAESLRNPHSI